MMASARDSKLSDKHQMILTDLLKQEDNRFCADCLAKGPRWASWNLGIFLCIRCAGIHRKLGVHLSRVKSVNLDSWSADQVKAMEDGGNAKAKAVYEETLPAGFRRPEDDYSVEQFIRSKYERKQYVGKGKDKHKAAAPSTQETKTRKAEVKKTTTQASDKPKSSANRSLAVPRPQAVVKSNPELGKSSSQEHSSSVSTGRAGGKGSSAVEDLMSLDPSPTTAQQPMDLLTDRPLDTRPTPHLSSSLSTPMLATGVGVGGGGGAPLLPGPPPGTTKDGIMALYSSQPVYGAYTAGGLPLNQVYLAQGQVAAVRMAQQQQMAALQQVQQQQVQAVNHQMQQLKVQQRQHIAVGNSSATPTTGAGPGGQTLNPLLW